MGAGCHPSSVLVRRKGSVCTTGRCVFLVVGVFVGVLVDDVWSRYVYRGLCWGGLPQSHVCTGWVFSLRVGDVWTRVHMRVDRP